MSQRWSGRWIATACLSLVAVVGSACAKLTTITLDASDGILPVWYEETFEGLPSSYSQQAWPDGTWEYHLNAFQTLTISAATLPDGSRDLAFLRDVFLIDARTAAYYRDQYGTDMIGGLSAVDLALLDLSLDPVDFSVTGYPELFVGDEPIAINGDVATLPPDLLDLVRDKLLAAADIHLPFRITFHLANEALDAMPTRIHLYVAAQPTLHVNLLDTI